MVKTNAKLNLYALSASYVLQYVLENECTKILDCLFQYISTPLPHHLISKSKEILN